MNKKTYLKSALKYFLEKYEILEYLSVNKTLKQLTFNEI
jgi:hypothetical protein